MSKRIILGVGGLLLAAPALASGLAAFEQVLKENDQEKLGKLLGECIQSQYPDSKIDRVEAENELAEEFDKLEKRKTGDRPMLALTDDLERALWFAQDYGQHRIKGGDTESYETTVPRYGQELSYAVWAPPEYNPRKGTAFPLLLILPDVPTPGQAATPEQLLTEEWQEPVVRGGAILAALSMPEDVKTWTELTGGVANLMTAYADITRRYAVDFDRIYLVGHGAGVEAAMAIANRFPDRFAGVVGRRGDAGEVSPGNFKNLPTFFAGGGARATAFQEASKGLGQDNVTIAPEAGEAEMWAWIQEHARQGNPAEVVLVPGSPFPNKAYWIEVPPSDGATESRVEAKIDKATNTVTVDAKGVAEITLYYNDELVDLDQPVKVVCNGNEFTDFVPRNYNVFLELVYGGRSDPGRLYVARKRYDVSEAP